MGSYINGDESVVGVISIADGGVGIICSHGEGDKRERWKGKKWRAFNALIP